MFSVQEINKLSCHVTKLVYYQYISCAEAGFSQLNHVV